MTREEHVRECKKHAMEYVEQGQLVDAVTSMASDMTKHPETGINDYLVMVGGMYAANYDREGVIRWIEGFRE